MNNMEGGTGVLPFQQVRRKRTDRAGKSKGEDLPSSKRLRQGLWIVNESLEMSAARRQAGKLGAESTSAAIGQCCCCCSDQYQATPRRSTRLARKKEELHPTAFSCCCNRSVAEQEDKENHPIKEPLCLTSKTGVRAQQRKKDEFSSLIDTWGMELNPPLKIHRSPTQKAALFSTSTPATTPRGGAPCTNSPQQAPSPTSELAAQLEDLVFTGHQTPGAQQKTPPEDLTKHGNNTRVLRSKRQVSLVKKNAKDDPVGLDTKGDLCKGKGESCNSVSDSLKTGRGRLSKKEGGNMAAGEEKDPAVIESPTVSKHRRPKEREGVLTSGSEPGSPRSPPLVGEPACELLCRDSELNTLEVFLKKHVCGRQPGSLYVSGPPGTGKSASISHLLDSRPDLTANASVVVLNCMTLRSPQAIFSSLLDRLQALEPTRGGKGRPQTRSIQDRLTHIITNSKQTILLVLDEMDQLDCKGQEILYSIFEWPSLPSSQLVLIGIANALDLTDRILPRLQMRPKYRPQLLNFLPYDKDQLVTILEQKLPTVLSSGVVFDPSAVQFCARKVSSVHGDLRKAMDICRRSVEVLESKRKQDKGLETASSQLRVSIPLVAEVIAEVYGARMVGGAQDTFPLQQKMAVCTLLMLVRGKTLKEVELGKLHSAYVKVCQKRKLKYESESEFVDVCSMLEARGVLSVKKAKERRLAKVNLNLQESEVNHALHDAALLSSVLEAGL